MANTGFESHLESTAEAIRSAVSGVADHVSDTLGDALCEAQRLIKAYPAATLIGAVVVGFAAGRLIRRG